MKFVFVALFVVSSQVALAQSDRGGHGIAQGLPLIQGRQVTDLCVTADGNTLQTAKPVFVCEQWGTRSNCSQDADCSVCLKGEKKVISFDRNTAVYTTDGYTTRSNCSQDADCSVPVNPHYIPAALSYTYDIVETTGYRSNCSQDADCSITQVTGQGTYTIPVCSSNPQLQTL